MTMCSSLSVATLAVIALLILCAAGAEDSSDLEEKLGVLSKQVTALLERRSEDLKSIEESMRKKLVENEQLGDIKEEIKSLRIEIEQLRKGTLSKSTVNKDQQLPQLSSQDKNDHLTVKWLTNTVTELKTELAEVQTTLNATVILQNHEQVGTEIALLKSDVQSLNKELESARSKNAKYEADILEMREEIGLLKDQSRATAVMCGKSKNQLKVAQIEWNYNLKNLNEKISSLTPSTEEIMTDHPSRHQRYLKKRIFELDRTTKHLHHSNEQLQSRILKLEEEIKILQQYSNREHTNTIHETKPNKRHLKSFEEFQQLSNEVSEKPFDFLSIDEKLASLGRQQRLNTIAIANLSRQLTNTDKLHMSMLELLENVESIENKIDKNFPEFRKEISKLEVEAAEAASSLSMLREDQTNTRDSVKAIGVSVSNLQEKVDKCKGDLKGMNETVEHLKKSTNVQTSKLHDHILKAESSTLDLNSTKSTIHLVEELKSFEDEYKSIVNKLPHDCSAVSGPDGIYLISPGDGEPILAYCKEGWTTIQKRYDGSVDFNRNWNEYSNGFGSATGEHWLGNRNLFYLTQKNCSQLQVNMKDIYGKYWQANYEEFIVADYSAGFKLTVGKYNGNASDALDYQNHMEFSTIDNDRDISNTHCASNYEGGWWFSHCQHANLNGRYNLGLTWFDSSRNEWIAVATSEMRIKKREDC